LNPWLGEKYGMHHRKHFICILVQLFFQLPYFLDHKVQYQKLNASYSFFKHKVHQITRRIK